MKNEILKRVLSSIILFIVTLYCIIKGSYIFVILIILIFLISSFEWFKMIKNKKYFFLGILYLIFSLFCVFQLRFNFTSDAMLFLLITNICILTDIGGFIFGKILKGPKLTKYSPNKTYSGMLGGYLCSFIIIFLLFEYSEKLFATNTKLLPKVYLHIIIISTASQIGDIIISYFKRLSKIKDTGKIIPGHGGILDRIDGMIFAFPFAYIIYLTNILET